MTTLFQGEGISNFEFLTNRSGDFRPLVKEVLSQARYSSTGNYNGEPCFLTAYQIAVLLNKTDRTLKGTLPIGGEGVGPDSFARQIAWHLSQDFNNKVFDNKLEIQFLSTDGLDSFTFDGGHKPSLSEFSMFRLL